MDAGGHRAALQAPQSVLVCGSLHCRRMEWRGAGMVVESVDYIFVNKQFAQTRQSRVVGLWRVSPGPRPPVEGVSRPPRICMPVEGVSRLLQLCLWRVSPGIVSSLFSHRTVECNRLAVGIGSAWWRCRTVIPYGLLLVSLSREVSPSALVVVPLRACTTLAAGSRPRNLAGSAFLGR